MARNGAGVFSVINPIEVGALRSSSAVNQNFTDMGDEITNTIPLTGVAGMDTGGQFKAADGSAAFPGISFDNDTNLGFRRPSNDSMAWVAGGVDRATIENSGRLVLSGALSVTGSLESSTSKFNPQTIVATTSASPALILRRTENDSAEHELARYESGDGSGAVASLRVVNGGANDVSSMRFYVNDVLTFQWSGTLFTHSLDVTYGSTGLKADSDGFFDFPELTASPSSPAANTARVFAKDDDGSTRFYYKDGSGNEIDFQSPVDRQTFTSSGTWTKPSQGQTMALVEVWGAGGSGERRSGFATSTASQSASGGGGGGGAYMRKLFALASLSSSVAITVGAGGASVTTANTSGHSGGNTSFGAYITTYGGAGGAEEGGGGGGGLTSAGGISDGSNGGEGGSPQGLFSSGVSDVFWGAGGNKFVKVENNSNPFGGAGNSGSGADQGEGSLFGGGGGGIGSTAEDGGFSVWGGGGGGGSQDTGNGIVSSGGTSLFAGSGGAGGTNLEPGVAGTAPAGGGGGSENAASGAGARGEVRVTTW